jgi:hypothetical protein
MWTPTNLGRRLRNSVILWAVLAIPLPASTIQLTFAPSSPAAAIGSPLSVDVIISGLGIPPEVGSFDVFVGFDPSLLAPVDIMFGGLLGDLSMLQALTLTNLSAGPGIVEASEVSLVPTAQLDLLQSPGFRLFTVDFVGIGDGAVSFQYLGGPVDDGNGNLIFGTKSVVPEPNYFFFVATALLLSSLKVAKREISAK